MMGEQLVKMKNAFKEEMVMEGSQIEAMAAEPGSSVVPT